MLYMRKFNDVIIGSRVAMPGLRNVTWATCLFLYANIVTLALGPAEFHSHSGFNEPFRMITRQVGVRTHLSLLNRSISEVRTEIEKHPC